MPVGIIPLAVSPGRVPRMPKYDRQLIVMFHCGTSADVKVVKDGAEALQKRGHQNEVNSKISHLIKAPTGAKNTKELSKELCKLTDQSRLYIYGHCDWAVQKVGTYTGQEMANLFKNCGLKKVKLISIVACKAARSYYDNFDDRLGSFASYFLEGLGNLGIASEVFARSDTTGTWPKGDNDPTMLGRKWTRPDDKSEDKTWLANKATGTKFSFTYQNKKVSVEKVLYKHEREDEL
jgi:hypothetical protein